MDDSLLLVVGYSYMLASIKWAMAVGSFNMDVQVLSMYPIPSSHGSYHVCLSTLPLHMPGKAEHGDMMPHPRTLWPTG